MARWAEPNHAPRHSPPPHLQLQLAEPLRIGHHIDADDLAMVNVNIAARLR